MRDLTSLKATCVGGLKHTLNFIAFKARAVSLISDLTQSCCRLIADVNLLTCFTHTLKPETFSLLM